MKVHRFIGAFDLHRALLQVTDRDIVHQMVRVLKLKPGEHVILCDGQGQEAVYEIKEAAPRSVTLAIIEERRANNAEPKRHVVLYSAILKRESFEWAVQKAVECGVSEIVPVVSDRTIKKDVKVERLQQIAKEAAEQSGRGRVPIVHEPKSFHDALMHAKQNDQNVFFHVIPANAGIHGSPMDPSFRWGDKRTGVFVGPEGGWSGEEAESARKAKWEIVSLGSRSLRGETACTVAVFLATT